MKPILNYGIVLATVAVCLLLFVPSQILAEEDPELTKIRELIHQVDSLIETRQLDTAIVLSELALEKAEKKFGESDTTVASLLHYLGRCYFHQANYAKCESLYNEALAIREKALGPDHPDVAQTLNNLALLYRDQGKYTGAEPLHKRALAIREKALGSDHPAVAYSLNNLALLYWDQGKYAEAEPLYKRAVTIKEKALGSDHPSVATSLNNLAILYLDQGKYAEAEPLHKRALAIREKALGSDHPSLAQTLNNLAILYRNQGKYAEAEPLYKRTLAIREKAQGSDHPDVGQTLNNLAFLYRVQGKYAEAEPLYKRALAIREKALGSDHPDVAQTLNNLALLYWDQGKYAEAEPLYKRALAIWEKSLGPDHPDVAIGLNNLALLYEEQGKYSQAEPLHKRALAVRKKAQGPDHPDVAVSLSNLAGLYWKQDKYPEAEPLCKLALAIKEKALGSHHPTIAASLDVLGGLNWDQGHYTEAESLFNRALAIKEKTLGANHPEVAKSLKSLAMLYGCLGEANKSLTYCKKLQQSRQHFVEYVFSYASEDQKMRYVKEYPLVNHSLLSFAIMTNSDESRSSALEMILKGKAVVIDAISAEKHIAFCSYDDEIQKKAERHAQVCGEVSTVTLVGVEKLDPEIYRDRLQTLYSIKDSLETELSKSCAEFKDELAARRFTVADVANALPEGSVLWEFVQYEPYDFQKVGSDKERTGPPRYLAFTLDRAGNTSLTDLGDAGEIDSLVNLARRMVYRARSEVHSASAAEAEKRLNEVTGRLYEIIFAPLESHLSGRANIYVCPDGQLNLLPFEILHCPDGQYVIEKFGISYLSSGRDLLRFKKKQEPTDWALALADPDFSLSQERLARHRDETLKKSDLISFVHEPSRGASGCLNNQFDPLPHSREEAKSVVKTLEKKAKMNVDSYYGGDALEEILKGMSTPPRVLHLATHGYFCEDLNLAENRMLENPLLRSGLAFSGANRLMDVKRNDDSQAEDGILTAFEASGLNLVGTELVTLSACETGVGQVKNGEGVYGLRRAFQCAGARTIVISLWKVPDKETCKLMDDFYENWLSGQTKKEALRQAALKILSDRRAKSKSTHPLFWGGFVLLGDPD